MSDSEPAAHRRASSSPTAAVEQGHAAPLVVGLDESKRQERRGFVIVLALVAGHLTFSIAVGLDGRLIAFFALCAFGFGALAFYGRVRSYVVFRPVDGGYLEATLVSERRTTRSEHVVRCAPADVEARQVGFAWIVRLQRRWSVVQTLTRRSAEAHVAAIRALSALKADEVAPKPERRARFDVGSPRGLRLVVGGGVGLVLGLMLASLLPQLSLLFTTSVVIGWGVFLSTFEWAEVELVRSEDDCIRVSHRLRRPGTAPSPWVVRDARELGWVRGRLVWWWTVDGERLGWCLHRAGVVRELTRLDGSQES